MPTSTLRLNRHHIPLTPDSWLVIEFRSPRSLIGADYLTALAEVLQRINGRVQRGDTSGLICHPSKLTARFSVE